MSVPRESEPTPPVRRHVVVHGRVQGVGYRYLARKHARRLGVAGWVRNLPDGTVAAEIEGDEASVATMLRRLEAGPPGSEVTRIEVAPVEATGEHEFRIVS
ncbi:acylphosphatase [Agromyces larvae]|uniref:acylphosphatase n=1 Tax=Agromyces larvae TaxID=2929802 RepID=A0ABY4C1B1_9MICO|nr:acylphosphatase [Agromyces larvae]UOE43921.1 acylphosphatase [Agromyces larvae]